MPERQFHHVSSAVVVVRPERVQEVMAALASMNGTEIRAFEGSRIVIVMEGPTAAELGDRLTEITSLAGVIAANMVFEHIEAEEVSGQ